MITKQDFVQEEKKFDNGEGTGEFFHHFDGGTYHIIIIFTGLLKAAVYILSPSMNMANLKVADEVKVTDPRNIWDECIKVANRIYDEFTDLVLEEEREREEEAKRIAQQG